jgi:tetratricopeptide (TPR) repeat protein
MLVVGTGSAVGLIGLLGANAAAIAICSVLPGWLVPRYASGRELARLPAYQADAHMRGDADALAQVRRIWTALAAKGARADALSQGLLGEELALRERWSEARDSFLRIDLRSVPDAYALNLEDWIAHTTAMAGDPVRALALIDEAIAQAKEPMLPHLGITRAKILVQLGRPGEAIEVLERAAKERVHARALNQRLYWLGVAHEGLGHDDAARDALARAAELPGPYAEKARLALAGKTPFRG